MFYLKRKRIINEVNGSALVFALLMTTILAVICVLVLRMEFFRLAFISKKIHQKQAVYYAEAGIYKTLWYLSGHEGITNDWRPVEESIEIFNNQKCYVTVKEWGAYLDITSRVNYKGISETVQVVAAEIPTSVYSQAVVLGNSKFPLVVTGKNRIIGDVTVSTEGVKTGKIEGKGFEGITPVQGRIHRRENPGLPFFDPTLFKNLFICYQNLLQYGRDCSFFYQDIKITDKIMKENKPENIYVNGHVLITDSLLSNSLTGPIKIISTGDIHVTDSIFIKEYVELIAAGNIYIKDQTSIDQGIIFAGEKVEISGQSSINAQVFTRGNIVIKEQAQVRYPSVLYCSGQVIDNVLRGNIIIQDNSQVIGAIILFPLEKERSYRNDETFIYITQGAMTAGVVYSYHSVDLRGCIYGTVVTSIFDFYLHPTSYRNWLKDAVIDRTQLPDNFLLPLSFRSDPVYKVLWWKG
ncbi:MAG: hypothetical protein R6V04_03330 [bacterium]